VLRTALLAILNTLRIENAAQYVVTNTRKISYLTATDQHNGVLLQVVAFTRNVGDDFTTVGQANLSHLTKCRVRLLWGGGVNAGANAALLRVLFHCWNLALRLYGRAALANQLINSRHRISSPLFRSNGITGPGL